MTEKIETILKRVRKWTPERQREAAEMLKFIGEQDHSPFHLTDEQLAEVRRRRGATDTKLLTLEEFDARLSRFGL